MLDYFSIPGWDKVDRLAIALLDLKGRCVSTSQAEAIKKLYNELDEFDKRPLVYKPRKPSTKNPGRLGKKRFLRSGHDTVDMVRR